MQSEKGVAVQTWSLTKRYKQYEREIERLMDILSNKSRSRCKQFTAVDSIDMQLMEGETLGIIGKNGSGKSTLLQMICGTVTPTNGRVKVNGRVGALLELGTGFNQEFTGIDNVKLNASVLGLGRKEIGKKMKSILEFADIGDFIDRPVKEYSSGMIVRLAFAVQAHIDPSVLVIDEALAVGDELFQKKCFERLKHLKESGCSIILVSHSSRQINEHCDRVMLMSKGEVLMEGLPHEITTVYQSLLPVPEDTWKRILKKTEGGKTMLLNAREPIKHCQS